MFPPKRGICFAYRGSSVRVRLPSPKQGARSEGRRSSGSDFEVRTLGFAPVPADAPWLDLPRWLPWATCWRSRTVARGQQEERLAPRRSPRSMGARISTTEPGGNANVSERPHRPTPNTSAGISRRDRGMRPPRSRHQELLLRASYQGEGQRQLDDAVHLRPR